MSLPDTLPSTLDALGCAGNQLTTLPNTLPAGLTELYCEYNQLITLPETLPAGLTYLACHFNNLTRLPTLPTGLTTLYCFNNRLTRLPETLPAGLRELYCWVNNLPTRKVNESILEYIHRVNAIAEAASKERIIQRCALVFEELAKKVWHPQRVERLMLAGVDMEDM